MIKKILCGFLLITIECFSLNFSIAPTEFEVDLTKNATYEAHILNNTAESLRIEIYLENALGYEEKTLIDDIIIFPKVVSIRPGGKQTIRFRIKENKLKQKGSYKSLLVFREKPSKIKKHTDRMNQNFSTKLSFITEIAIAIKGEKK